MFCLFVRFFYSAKFDHKTAFALAEQCGESLVQCQDLGE